jgi:hypothetical protein
MTEPHLFPEQTGCGLGQPIGNTPIDLPKATRGFPFVVTGLDPVICTSTVPR